MTVQPTGTVTLFFSDIEGSTELVRRHGPERYAKALDRHRTLVRNACTAHGGYVVDWEGDGFFLAFPSAGVAVDAAEQVQRALKAEPWPAGMQIAVRIGLHTGDPLITPPKYVGLDVHRAARVMAAAHGGQVVLTPATAALLDERVRLRDLGVHRLKDLPEPTRLYQLVADGLAEEFPPLRTVASMRSPIREPSTELIGRDDDVAEIVGALRDPSVRLLTLTGAGGIGKTRLALRAANVLAPAFADGAILVPLASVTEAAVVAASVAQALGVPIRTGADAVGAIVDDLERRHMLLLLDNFEQVIDAAPVVASLLAAAPRLKIVVTSRMRLRLDGERVYRVPPLAESRAVELFVERARAIDDGFALDARSTAHVATLCAELDGLPLAIELAAARTAVLTAQELLERITTRRDVLGVGPRDAEARQRTMRATVDWSYTLLTPTEQRLFADLGSFVDGWTLSAAQAVSEADEETTIDVLGALVEANLVQRDPGGDESRFRMYETIRAYAEERLEASGRDGDVRRRHAEWVAALTERAERSFSAEKLHWIGRLEAESGNVRAALEWSVARAETTLALRMLAALWRPWTSLGLLTEGYEWAMRVQHELELDGVDVILEARFLHAASHFAEGSDPEVSEQLSLACLELSRKAGYREGIAWGLAYLAERTAAHGHLDQADALLAEAHALAAELGDDFVLDHVLSAVAMAAFARGDYPRAIAGFEHELQRAQQRGDLASLGRALGNLAFLSLCVASYTRAISLAEQSLAIQVELNNKVGIAWALANVGLARLLAHDVDGAATALESALEWQRTLRHRRRSAECLFGLAAVAAVRADVDRAGRLRAFALALLESMGEQPSPPELAIERGVLQRCMRETPSSLRDEWSRLAARTPVEDMVAIALAPTTSSRIPVPIET